MKSRHRWNNTIRNTQRTIYGASRTLWKNTNTNQAQNEGGMICCATGLSDHTAGLDAHKKFSHNGRHFQSNLDIHIMYMAFWSLLIYRRKNQNTVKVKNKVCMCVKGRKRTLEREGRKGVCRLPAPFYTPDFQGALREQLSPAVGALLDWDEWINSDLILLDEGVDERQVAQQWRGSVG